jgi:hypothetical protein
MHPLIRRILIRGTFVGVGTVAVALGLRRMLETYLNSDPQHFSINPADDFGLQGPIVFGMIGFFLLAIMEWISYGRDRAKQFKQQESVVVKQGQARIFNPDAVDHVESAKI